MSGEEIQIVEPRPAQSLECWDELEPHIEAALEFDINNTVTVAELRDQVGNGYARVLICALETRIVAVTIAQLYQNKREERIMHVIATGGERSHLWMALLSDYLEMIAAKERCVAVTMSGRPGWAKKLTKLGYRTEQVCMRREVDYGGEESEPADVRLDEQLATGIDGAIARAIGSAIIR